MLKHNQHGRYYMNLQQFGRITKANKTGNLAWLIVSLLRFNYNGINKKRFMRLANMLPKNFARDTRELQELQFFKVIDREIFVNPALLWSGSERVRAYRQKCFDLGVHDLDDIAEQPSDDSTWIDYVKARIEVEEERLCN